MSVFRRKLHGVTGILRVFSDFGSIFSLESFAKRRLFIVLLLSARISDAIYSGVGSKIVRYRTFSVLKRVFSMLIIERCCPPTAKNDCCLHVFGRVFHEQAVELPIGIFFGRGVIFGKVQYMPPDKILLPFSAFCSRFCVSFPIPAVRRGVFCSGIMKIFAKFCLRARECGIIFSKLHKYSSCLHKQ